MALALDRKASCFELLVVLLMGHFFFLRRTPTRAPRGGARIVRFVALHSKDAREARLFSGPMSIPANSTEAFRNRSSIFVKAIRLFVTPSAAEDGVLASVVDGSANEDDALASVARVSANEDDALASVAGASAAEDGVLASVVDGSANEDDAL